MATQGKIRIFKREAKKGITYSYSIEAGRDASGKRRRVTKSGFKTAKEARAAAQPILNKLLLGDNILESNITFADYAEEWFNEYKLNIKPATQRRFKYSIKTANKYFKNKKLRSISLYEYQQFINEYAKDKKYLTVSNMHFILRKIFSYAVKYNIIRSNPTKEVTLPTIIPNKKKEITDLYLTKNELTSFLNYIKDYSSLYKKPLKTQYVYPLCATLAYTGVRIAEASALTWQDIDFKNKKLNIHSSMFAESYNNYKKQTTPKNLSSIRTIVIGDILINILKKWKMKQLEQRLLNGTQNKRDEEDYIFTQYIKSKDWEYPVIPNALAAIFRTINNQHIFKKHIYAHLFRHTHVSLLAEAGVSLEVIQERLGHSNDIITRTVYLHITERQKENAAKIFDKYISI